jgi:hypothetical protein
MSNGRTTLRNWVVTPQFHQGDAVTLLIYLRTYLSHLTLVSTV